MDKEEVIRFAEWFAKNKFFYVGYAPCYNSDSDRYQESYSEEELFELFFEFERQIKSNDAESEN